MSNKVKMSLSTKSINELLRKLDNIPTKIEKSVENSLKEVMSEAYMEVVMRTPVDTGESVSSTDVNVGNGKATLSQEGDHVFENEFGDGIYGQQSGYPGVRPSSYPTHTDTYRFTPTNPQSKYYHAVGSHVRTLTSGGQIAHAQMYHGGQYIRNNINKVIKKKVSGALSKI